MSSKIKSLDLDELLMGDREAAVRMAHLNLDPATLPEETTVRHLHYNKPQLRSMMVGANEEYDVMGRGTGKSEGIIAPRTKRNVEVMPRSHGCFVGATYLQLLERTLPPVVKGWEAMGWKKDRDFWVRRQPPKSLNIPQPIIGALTPEHCIYFRDGTVASLVSQDRPGSANGKTVHWIVGDEAKFLDKKALDSELLMTNRGDERFFGGIPEFHSLLFCTDMPTWKEAMWILDQEKRMEPERIKLIMACQMEIFKLWQVYSVSTGRKKAAAMNKIRKYQAYYDELRKNAVYFNTASTWDNVEGFGKKNILRLKKSLPRYIYNTAILNLRPFLEQEAFYPDLTIEHTYDSYDYTYVDSGEFGQVAFDDCRKDGDFTKAMPLHIALDYGAHINTLAIGQYGPMGGFNVINSLEVVQPHRMKDLAKKFLYYYRHVSEGDRMVYFYYDHTALTTNAVTDFSYADEWIDLLVKGKWRVKPVYIGHTPSPSARYEMWGDLLRGEHELIRKVGFNRNNCHYLLESMRNAKVKKGVGRDEFKKNKDDERNVEIDQRETTHHSDGADTLLWGVCENPKLSSSIGSVGIVAG